MSHRHRSALTRMNNTCQRCGTEFIANIEGFNRTDGGKTVFTLKINLPLFMYRLSTRTAMSRSLGRKGTVFTQTGIKLFQISVEGTPFGQCAGSQTGTTLQFQTEFIQPPSRMLAFEFQQPIFHQWVKTDRK